MSESPVPTRPLAKRVVLWGLMLLALWNLGRAAVLYRQAGWVSSVEVIPDPRLRMVLASAWAIIFLAATWVLLNRSCRNWRAIPLLMTLFGVYELGMMIAFATEPPAPLLVLAYAAFVCFVVWVLWRPRGER